MEQFHTGMRNQVTQVHSPSIGPTAYGTLRIPFFAARIEG
jgi:hypothetical protein